MQVAVLLDTKARRVKAPAFQFYAKDWDTGTARLSLKARGLYISMLAVSWDSGPLPKDVQDLAALVRAKFDDFSEVWDEVKPKWKLTSKGYINERLEQERQKQEDYRAKQSKKGLASAQQRFNRGSTVVQPKGEPEGQPETQPKFNSSSSSSSSLALSSSSASSKGTEAPAGAWRPRTPVSSALFHNARACGYCSERICVPMQVHRELLGRMKGQTDALTAFYVETVAGLPDTPFGDDPFAFWRHAFADKFGTVSKKPLYKAQGDSIVDKVRRGEV